MKRHDNQHCEVYIVVTTDELKRIIDVTIVETLVLFYKLSIFVFDLPHNIFEYLAEYWKIQS